MKFINAVDYLKTIHGKDHKVHLFYEKKANKHLKVITKLFNKSLKKGDNSPVLIYFCREDFYSSQYISAADNGTFELFKCAKQRLNEIYNPLGILDIKVGGNPNAGYCIISFNIDEYYSKK